MSVLERSDLRGREAKIKAVGQVGGWEIEDDNFLVSVLHPPHSCRRVLIHVAIILTNKKAKIKLFYFRFTYKVQIIFSQSDLHKKEIGQKIFSHA